MEIKSPLFYRLRDKIWERRRLKRYKEFIRLSPEEQRYFMSVYDDRVPLPPGAEEELSSENPELEELRRRYNALDLPVSVHSQWGANTSRLISQYLRHFRGDSPYVWHYRELPKVTRLKYFVFLKYILEIDESGLLQTLEEDGAFGCWHYNYPDYPTVSRDLLDSVNEINYLDRQLGVMTSTGIRVLDIGAGYGRLAHRFVNAVPGVKDYCCVDAIPESTFLCDYYLRFRDLAPKARVVPLDKIQSDLKIGDFDLAINIHSFSECSLAAVTWWMEKLAELDVPRLMIVPNEPDEFLTTEPDRSERDYRPVIERMGYRVVHEERCFTDPGVRDVLGVNDKFYLFERKA